MEKPELEMSLADTITHFQLGLGLTVGGTTHEQHCLKITADLTQSSRAGISKPFL